MKPFLLGGLLAAGLLAGCQSAPSSTAAESAVSATRSAAATSAASPTRASVMRQHDAQMARMDALAAERQRLQAVLRRLDSTTVAGQRQARRLRRATVGLGAADAAMMNWMHHYQEPDTARLTARQHEDFWADQARQLAAVERAMTAALDSGSALR
jgi:outer membrane PBP1 activator LpoA protein